MSLSMAATKVEGGYSPEAPLHHSTVDPSHLVHVRVGMEHIGTGKELAVALLRYFGTLQFALFYI
jgi:hypothetical protein